MYKDKIIEEKKALINWAADLKSISYELWFKSFREGSWGVADVISHFISWDQFLIKNRINFLLKEEQFPMIPFDAEEINKLASLYARSGKSKDELIDEFIHIRKEVVSLIERIPSEKFDQTCPGKSHISLNEYFEGLIVHDRRHRKQIDQFIMNTTKQI